MGQLTVLCENTVTRPGHVGEYGFSVFLETSQGNLLFDTGQGTGLVPNSLRLGKDLRQVSRVVLSHGHFDHTGGLLPFLEAHGPCDIIAHPDVLTERYRLVPPGQEGKPLSIGMPWNEGYLTSRGARFVLERNFLEVLDGVFLSGEVPRRTSFETGDPLFALKQGGEWVPDPIRDDFSLIVKTDKGLLVLCGCAHAGVINVLEHAMEKTGGDRVHAVIGGTHLGFSPPEQLEATIHALRKLKVKVLATSHCTGQYPTAKLLSVFGASFAFANVGYTLSFSS